MQPDSVRIAAPDARGGAATLRQIGVLYLDGRERRVMTSSTTAASLEAVLASGFSGLAAPAIPARTTIPANSILFVFFIGTPRKHHQALPESVRRPIASRFSFHMRIRRLCSHR